MSPEPWGSGCDLHGVKQLRIYHGAGIQWTLGIQPLLILTACSPWVRRSLRVLRAQHSKCKFHHTENLLPAIDLLKGQIDLRCPLPLSQESQTIYKMLTSVLKLALVLGNEGDGVSSDVYKGLIIL